MLCLYVLGKECILTQKLGAKGGDWYTTGKQKDKSFLRTQICISCLCIQRSVLKILNIQNHFDIQSTHYVYFYKTGIYNLNYKVFSLINIICEQQMWFIRQQYGADIHILYYANNADMQYKCLYVGNRYNICLSRCYFPGKQYFFFLLLEETLLTYIFNCRMAIYISCFVDCPF